MDSHSHAKMSTGSWLFHSYFILCVLKTVFLISLFSSAKLFSTSSHHWYNSLTCAKFQSQEIFIDSLFVFKSHSSTLLSLPAWTSPESAFLLSISTTTDPVSHRSTAIGHWAVFLGLRSASWHITFSQLIKGALKTFLNCTKNEIATSTTKKPCSSWVPGWTLPPLLLFSFYSLPPCSWPNSLPSVPHMCQFPSSLFHLLLFSLPGMLLSISDLNSHIFF